MLIKSQQAEIHKNNNSSNLESNEKSTYTPAYKEGQKTESHAETRCLSALPPELADIVEAWSRLPESIKSAILMLVKASEQYTKA